ncbi:hypothetical protein CRUP_032091, partial [Coryphaenoides rupestris]
MNRGSVRPSVPPSVRPLGPVPRSAPLVPCLGPAPRSRLLGPSLTEAAARSSVCGSRHPRQHPSTPNTSPEHGSIEAWTGEPTRDPGTWGPGHCVSWRRSDVGADVVELLSDHSPQSVRLFAAWSAAWPLQTSGGPCGGEDGRTVGVMRRPGAPDLPLLLELLLLLLLRGLQAAAEPSSSVCCVVTVAPVSAGFRSLDVEDAGGVCGGDWLLLRPAGGPESRLCGSTLPPPFTSSRGRLELHFHSGANSSGQAQGFRLTFSRGQSRCQPDYSWCRRDQASACALAVAHRARNGADASRARYGTPGTSGLPSPAAPQARPLPRRLAWQPWGPYNRARPAGPRTSCLPAALRCNGNADCPDGSDERGCPDAACGRRLRNFYGSFASPHFFFRADHSPAGAELCCAWFLDTQDPKPIVLQLDLQLGPADSLSVYDGLLQRPHQLLQVLSHHNNRRPAHLESSRGQMSVLYRAHAHSPGRGFNATYQVKGYCFPGERPCGAEQGCYTAGQRCDGVWDCHSGRDEEGCPACADPAHYPCGPAPGPAPCYPPQERCNNLKSCPDGADEAGCSECQPGSFHCRGERCVPEAWRCDGQKDCLDASDEDGCRDPVPRKVITAALIGTLGCSLLLVIALGCAFKLYSLRTSDSRAFETQMTRLEAEFVQREAPPSYGQLIAQGLIPPIRRSSSRRRVTRLWRQVSQRLRPRGHTSLLTPPTGAMVLHSYRTVENQGHAPSSPCSPDVTSHCQQGAELSPVDSWAGPGDPPAGPRPSRDRPVGPRPSRDPPHHFRRPALGLMVSLRGVALHRYSPLGHMSPSVPAPSREPHPQLEGEGLFG